MIALVQRLASTTVSLCEFLLENVRTMHLDKVPWLVLYLWHYKFIVKLLGSDVTNVCVL